MNKLPLEKRTQIIHLLVEGNSPRSTSRIADVSINTVTKVLVDTGDMTSLQSSVGNSKEYDVLTCKVLQQGMMKSVMAQF